MKRFGCFSLFVITIGFSIAGCKKETKTGAPATLRAEAPKTAECAACSMVVREQPAPRGQLIHRDGTRKFFCSIADMLQYLRAPSAHGKPKAIFVEALDPKADPKKTDPKARPWISAEKASYVTGVPRPNVMGAPVLVYQKRSDAERVKKEQSGSELRDLDGLKAALIKKPKTSGH